MTTLTEFYEGPALNACLTYDLLVISKIFWIKWLSKWGPLKVYMIYLDSQLQDSVPPTNAEEKDLWYSRSDSQILVKSTDLAETLHGQRHQSNFTPSQVSSHLPALRDRAHPSHHLFNALKISVGCYFLIIFCFRLSSSSGHLYQCFPGWPQPSAPQNQDTPSPDRLYFHLSGFCLTPW